MRLSNQMKKILLVLKNYKPDPNEWPGPGMTVKEIAPKIEGPKAFGISGRGPYLDSSMQVSYNRSMRSLWRMGLVRSDYRCAGGRIWLLTYNGGEKAESVRKEIEAIFLSFQPLLDSQNITENLIKQRLAEVGKSFLFCFEALVYIDLEEPIKSLVYSKIRTLVKEHFGYEEEEKVCQNCGVTIPLGINYRTTETGVLCWNCAKAKELQP